MGTVLSLGIGFVVGVVASAVFVYFRSKIVNKKVAEAQAAVSAATNTIKSV
jgi:hypothetical protein